MPSPTLSPTSPTALISKLRWANIGWSYHWGSKQYDFTKGKGRIDDETRNVCKRAVRSVNWKEVFGQSDQEGWGDEHWRTWQETYGMHPRAYIVLWLTSISHVEPDAGIVNYYQIKV